MQAVSLASAGLQAREASRRLTSTRSLAPARDADLRWTRAAELLGRQGGRGLAASPLARPRWRRRALMAFEQVGGADRRAGNGARLCAGALWPSAARSARYQAIKHMLADMYVITPRWRRSNALLRRHGPSSPALPNYQSPQRPRASRRPPRSSTAPRTTSRFTAAWASPGPLTATCSTTAASNALAVVARRRCRRGRNATRLNAMSAEATPSVGSSRDIRKNDNGFRTIQPKKPPSALRSARGSTPTPRDTLRKNVKRASLRRSNGRCQRRPHCGRQGLAKEEGGGRLGLPPLAEGMRRRWRTHAPSSSVIWGQEEATLRRAHGGVFTIGHGMCVPTVMAWGRR